MSKIKAVLAVEKLTVAVAVISAHAVLLPHACRAGCLEFTAEIVETPCSLGYAIGQDTGTGGSMVGYLTCGIAGGEYPFFWSKGELTFFPMPSEFPNGRALAVNNANWVAGWMNDDPGVHRAFLFDGQQVVDLGMLPGDFMSEAYGMNNANPPVIAGYSLNASSKVAVVWIDGKIQALDLPLAPYSVAYDANDNGTICGWMGGGNSTPFLWDDQNGGAALPMPVGAKSSQARALNNLSDACGYYVMPNQNNFFPTFAILWSDGEMIDLGILPGYSKSRAWDINDDQVVVGICENGSIVTGFIWRDGVMIKLDDLVTSGLEGLKISIASGISNSGQIACKAQVSPSSTPVAALLTPIPPMPGDTNCDKLVDVDDLLLVINNWS